MYRLLIVGDVEVCWSKESNLCVDIIPPTLSLLSSPSSNSTCKKDLAWHVIASVIFG